MCVLSSALGGWLLSICVTIGVCLSPTLASTSVCTHVDPAWASPPLPHWGLRLARTGGPIKLTLWVLGLLARSRGKGPFYCCVNHCFISTRLFPSLCSDTLQGFWPPFKWEHNTAIEIIAHTSCPQLGSALPLVLIATTLCSITRLKYAFRFFYPQFCFDSGYCTGRLTTNLWPIPHLVSFSLNPESGFGGPQCAGNRLCFSIST